MSTPVTRRRFLGTTGRTAVAGLTLGSALSQTRAQGAHDRFTVALIGCGGMGRHKLGNFIDIGAFDVAALCDVDDAQLAEAQKLVAGKDRPKPKQVKDYQQIIDMKDVDVVIVATPDHWHAAPMMLACQAGKDVYVEKPCRHNILEGRAMVDAARKYKRIVQVGTHQRSAPHIQAARDFVQEGELGKISMTETFTYGNESPKGMGKPADQDAPPPGVDYNTWLGAAPERKFNPARFHKTWRWFFDYGCGMIGDWNVHLQDIIMWTMDTPYPISVVATGGHLILEDERDTPDTMVAVYAFPPSKWAPKGHVHKYTLRKASGKPWWAGGYGMDFHGTNGYLHCTRQGWEVQPDKVDWSKGNSPDRIEPMMERGQDSHPEHVANFLQALQERTKPIASIEEHFKTVAACHLANVSIKVGGRKLWWDPKKELCFKDPELKIEDGQANQHLGREYRKGFELPEV